MHTHLTRDIRPKGSGCPACDEYWDNHPPANAPGHTHPPITGVRIHGTCPGCDAWWERMGERLTDDQALDLKQDGVSLRELLTQINDRTPDL